MGGATNQSYDPQSRSGPLTRQGLSTRDASTSLATVGFNEIQSESAPSGWHVLVLQFRSPLVLILILACVLSAALGDWIEGIAIAAIVILNSLIGYFQEYRAERAVVALNAMTAPEATVLRDGQRIIVLARTLVPEDLVVLEAGDVVAADARVLESSSFQVNEAVLTGESIAVKKKPEPSLDLGETGATVFMGTSVVSGTALAQVTATGMRSELGKIANLITHAGSSPTPLQIQLARVGKMLLYLCLAIAGGVVVIGLFQHRPWLEVLVFAVSLAVAVVPEGMPAIVTVALALGVRRMAARKALIRGLSNVETLGSVSVICTDKTGTLTTGQMKVRELWGEDHRELLQVAASCCDAELDAQGLAGTGDPTELAILIAAKELSIRKEKIESSNGRLKTEPFNSETRRMSVLRADNILYVKGALESVLPFCLPRGQDDSKDESKYKKAATAANLEMTSHGLRVLAVATGSGLDGKNLKLRGLIGIADPPRAEAKWAIEEAKRAGILTIMITGDSPVTAAAIARELGLAVNEAEISERVHARAKPEDKLKIIRDLKAKGKIVAMTGDGVNDAPALKEAHIGIAMGRGGTEVTRQAADLILVDDNYATIVAAVKEGRGVYRNIQKAIVYLLTGNFGELAIILGAIAWGSPVPFLASHLLWINLVTDSLPGLALIAEPVSEEVMKIPPRTPSTPLLGRSEWLRILVVGALEGMVTLALFLFVLNSSGLSRARNLAFPTLVLSQLFRSFAARADHRVFWQVGALGNIWLLGVVLVTILIQLSLHFISFTQRAFGLSPLSGTDLVVILSLSLVTVTFVELKKLIVSSRNMHSS